MKITLVAGARPNFMKIAPIMHALREAKQAGANLQYRLIHTGQHYDKAMSESFFDDLSIPYPDANLEVGSGTQAVQTGNIMIKFEEEVRNNPTDVVLVVGDINSTMACSIVAKKLNTQLVHVEAGIRSFDLSMPEEINRMVTDSIADHFFTTSQYANKNLKDTGISESRIHFVGNTMIDSLYANLSRLRESQAWTQNGLTTGNYLVLTLHRPSNVDDEVKLHKILSKISETTQGLRVIFPAHPRTVTNLKKVKGSFQNIVTVEPMGYLEFIHLVKNARAVITDSGGIQEETTVLGVPCITLRKNSERPETISVGTNELIHEIDDLEAWMSKLFSGQWKKGSIPELWDGKTSHRIVKKLMEIYN